MSHREHLSIFERLTASEREAMLADELDETAAERKQAAAEVEAERAMLGLTAPARAA